MAQKTLLALRNLDPSFLTSFLISIVSSSSSNFFSTSFSATSSSFWSAITSDPKIVRSCVSTPLHCGGDSDKIVHHSVPYSELYLQAYVHDEIFIERLLNILRLMNPTILKENNVGTDVMEKEKEEKEKKYDANKIKVDNKKEDIKYQNVHARTEKDENKPNTTNKTTILSPILVPDNGMDIRWERNLKSWSIL